LPAVDLAAFISTAVDPAAFGGVCIICEAGHAPNSLARH
jgi:hypothetical protein